MQPSSSTPAGTTGVEGKKGESIARKRAFHHETTRVTRRSNYVGRHLHRSLKKNEGAATHKVTRRYLTAASNAMHVIACRIVAAAHDLQRTEHGEGLVTGGILVAAIHEVLDGDGGCTYQSAAQGYVSDLEQRRIARAQEKAAAKTTAV
jgi:hypothetical protein